MQVKLIAKQKTVDSNLQMSFIANVPKREKSAIIGTLLNELFGFMSLAKKHRTERYLSNAVTDVKFVIGSVFFDTESVKTSNCDAAKVLRAKMKLRNNAKGKKAFAQLVYDLIEFMSREQYKMTFEQLIANLDREIAADEILKTAELN